LCDGIKLHPFNTPKYLREVILPNIEAGAKKAGRDLREIEVCGSGFVITGKNEEEVEKAKAPVRQQLAFYASTRTYQPVLDIQGWGDLTPELNSLSIEGKWQEMATRLTDDMLEEFAVIGTYDEIVPKIKAKAAGLIDRTTFTIPVRSPEDGERLKSLIKELQAG
jgi:alkanesulfonate monooxygenase SsuD/methylene tetrahydromethanopterin reductase-like flavin-dependent oxidoreductase (luciferase family)